MTSHLEPTRENLYNEMLGRIQQTDTSVPVKLDGTLYNYFVTLGLDYYYYIRTEEGKQYQICRRKKGDMNAPEEILLDVNKIAEGKKFCKLGEFEVNKDHSILAYSLDTDGSEHFTLHFKNLKTGELYPESITDTSSHAQPDHTSSFAWANDGKHVFYIKLDEASRPYKIFRHKVGSPEAEDSMLFHEKDDILHIMILLRLYWIFSHSLFFGSSRLTEYPI
jgi:oligopeptidase B